MSRPTPPQASLHTREQRLLQRLFGDQWERAALRIQQLAAKRLPHGGNSR